MPTLIKPIAFSLQRLPRRILAWSSTFGLAACLAASLAACAGHNQSTERRAAILDLDSLHRVVVHNDSVEANYFFYEDAFEAYKAVYLGVDKPSYMAVARGNDQDFCLFQPDPGRRCADIGDKFKALELEEPARDAYEAGLLSEGVNGDTLNIRLWSGLAELHFGWGKHKQAETYLTKVLEVDGKNKWAERMRASMPREASAVESMRTESMPAESKRKPAAVPASPKQPGAGKKKNGRQVRSPGPIGRSVDHKAVRKGPIAGLARIPAPLEGRGGQSDRATALD